MLVNASGVVKLADFGMAKHVGSLLKFDNGLLFLNCYSIYILFFLVLNMNMPDLIFFLPRVEQLSGASAVLSLKGTPYWMAPEVLFRFNFR